MAYLGNIGIVRPSATPRRSYSLFGANKHTTSVIASETSSTPDAIVHLSMSNGTRIEAGRTDPVTGDWQFVDLDDGTYYVTVVGTGEAWSVVIVGSVATVTALSGGGGSGGTVGFAWVS